MERINESGAPASPPGTSHPVCRFARATKHVSPKRWLGYGVLSLKPEEPGAINLGHPRAPTSRGSCRTGTGS